jgi:hypothetical protein
MVPTKKISGFTAVNDNAMKVRLTECENNTKRIGNTKKGVVIRQKSQNNTFYSTGITPSRGK